MDLPPDEPTAPVAPDAVAPPARTSRFAQRRRVASARSGQAASVVAETGVVADPGATATVPAMIAAEPAPDVEPAAPVSDMPAPLPVAEAAPAPADPVSLTPPAPVEAETTVEDQIMDYASTTDTVADNANDTADQMVDRGQAVFSDMSGRAKDAMDKGSKMVEEIGAFGKGNLEAMVESSKIAAKGLETLGQDAAEFTRKSFESATAAMKTLAATRSPTEFMKLQGDYARQMFDTMIAETSRSTEKMLKLANDVAQPLSNRVAVAADKMKVAA